MAAAERLAPYQALIDATEAMCGLVSAGHLDELAALQQRAELLWAAVPERPSPEARDLLLRLQQLTAHLQQALRAAGAELGAELGSVDRSRVAGRAYAPGGAAPSSQIDTAA